MKTTQNAMRVKALLLTPPTFSDNQPRLQSNLDTEGGFSVNWTFAMAFAALVIFPRTHTNLKVPRWLFYAFYPAHLLMIGLVRLALKV